MYDMFETNNNHFNRGSPGNSRFQSNIILFVAGNSRLHRSPPVINISAALPISVNPFTTFNAV